jgi:hypothetical protein
MSKKNKSKKLNIIDNNLEDNIKDNISFTQDKLKVIEETEIENKIEKNSISKKILDDNIILKDLLNRQIKNINSNNKFKFNDIKRISKFITSSIFDETNCSLWTGYITNDNNNSKGTYINFYFNKKKIALHRLLYENYVDKINEDDYIKFTCLNKGKCCNINHLKKFSYNKNEVTTNSNQNIDNNIKINLDKNSLTLEF